MTHKRTGTGLGITETSIEEGIDTSDLPIFIQTSDIGDPILGSQTGLRLEIPKEHKDWLVEHHRKLRGSPETNFIKTEGGYLSYDYKEEGDKLSENTIQIQIGPLLINISLD